MEERLTKKEDNGEYYILQEELEKLNLKFSQRESGKEYVKRLDDAFQKGKECECRSIVARLKNKFHDVGRGIIVFNEPVKGRYSVNLEDICNFILEDLDNA